MTAPVAEALGPYRCSVAAAARQEPMFATASRVDRWLLVEQPGPWGPESIPAARMDPAALAAVQRLAREYGARLLLIRSPASAELRAGRSVFLADSRPGREWLMSRCVPDEAALIGLEPPARDPEWQPDDEPLYLVCTHGRHDPCCALLGRPVAAALTEKVPDRTWECTHVGGDRFAGNVVVLPAGLYLGRLLPGQVPDAVRLLEAGRIPLAQLRGRSGLSLPAQAAQHYARLEQADAADGFDDLLPRSEMAVGDQRWRVVLADPRGDLAVTVERSFGDVAYQLTCHTPEPKRFPGFTLVSIEPAGG